MLSIDSNFPGGNIKVFESRGDAFNVAPDLRDTNCSWFYWAFRVRGAAGRTLAFRFVSDNPVGVRGPAISTDGRRSWRWTTEAFDTTSFIVSIPRDCDEIYLALAPLYTQENWDRFIATLPADAIQPGFFTASRKGRPVEILHAGAAPEKTEYHAIFAARHHCCEMIADYTMEGIVSTVVSGDSPEAHWLRDNVSFSFIPFVDKDGVEDGDQGKNRIPHDHARDYDRDDPIYPETIATANLVRTMVKQYGKLDFVADLHCPWIRGDKNEFVYLVGKDLPGDAVFRRKFGRYVERSCPADAIPYYQKNDVPYGTSWNTAANYTQGATLPGWAGKLLGVKAVASFEIPYANASGAVVTADSARLLGVAIAKGLALYLKPGRKFR